MSNKIHQNNWLKALIITLASLIMPIYILIVNIIGSISSDIATFFGSIFVYNEEILYSLMYQHIIIIVALSYFHSLLKEDKLSKRVFILVKIWYVWNFILMLTAICGIALGISIEPFGTVGYIANPVVLSVVMPIISLVLVVRFKKVYNKLEYVNCLNVNSTAKILTITNLSVIGIYVITYFVSLIYFADGLGYFLHIFDDSMFYGVMIALYLCFFCFTILQMITDDKKQKLSPYNILSITYIIIFIIPMMILPCVSNQIDNYVFMLKRVLEFSVPIVTTLFYVVYIHKNQKRK